MLNLKSAKVKTNITNIILINNYLNVSVNVVKRIKRFNFLND